MNLTVTRALPGPFIPSIDNDSQALLNTRSSGGYTERWAPRNLKVSSLLSSFTTLNRNVTQAKCQLSVRDRYSSAQWLAVQSVPTEAQGKRICSHQGAAVFNVRGQ
jgi:hypothetical protein